MDEAVDRVIAGIDREIDEAQVERDRGGWTTWALIGALASMFWFGTEALKDHLDLHVVGQIGIIGIFCWDFRTLVSASFEIQAEGPESNGRFFLGIRLAQTRTQILFVMLMQFALVALIVETIPRPPAFIFGVAMAVVAFRVLNALMIMGMSFMELPFPHKVVGVARSGASWTFLALIGSDLIVIGSYAHRLIGHWGTVLEWRMAAIITACYVLIPKLIASTSMNPLTLELREIRRELLFNDLSIDSAKERVQTVILGMRGADVVQKSVSALLNIYSQERTLLQRISSRHERGIEKLRLMSISEPAEHLGIWESGRASIVDADGTFPELEQHELAVQKITKRMARQIVLLQVFAPDGHAELEELLSQLRGPASEINQRILSLAAADKALKDQFDALLPTLKPR
jgi:hypothetical protein